MWTTTWLYAIRTPSFLHARRAFYQLSHIPSPHHFYLSQHLKADILLLVYVLVNGLNVGARIFPGSQQTLAGRSSVCGLCGCILQNKTKQKHLLRASHTSHLSDETHWIWQHTLVVPAVRRWRQEGQKFKAMLSYTGNLRPTLDPWDPVQGHRTGRWRTWDSIPGSLATKAELQRGFLWECAVDQCAQCPLLMLGFAWANLALASVLPAGLGFTCSTLSKCRRTEAASPYQLSVWPPKNRHHSFLRAFLLSVKENSFPF